MLPFFQQWNIANKIPHKSKLKVLILETNFYPSNTDSPSLSYKNLYVTLDKKKIN